MEAKKVVGFGEVLGSVRPRGYAAFGDTNEVLIMAGGSEANVLGKVSGLSPGIHSQLITRMKSDLIGRLLRYDMQKYRVGMDYVVWTVEDRNGFCFVEQGLGPIVAEGQYDRKNSAFATAQPHDYDFSVLEGASAFFISGITPALSRNALENSKLALEKAKEHSVPVFFDVNYRKKLWTPEQAAETLTEIVRRELLMCLVTTETDARVVFGVDKGFRDDSPLPEALECSKEILRELDHRLGGQVPIVVMTVRQRLSNERGNWSSVAYIHSESFVIGDSFEYVVLDRYGAGDSCSAGIIGGYLGVGRDGMTAQSDSLKDRIQNGLNLGNRMSVVAQKTVSDIGPQWSAREYFLRVGQSREIAR